MQPQDSIDPAYISFAKTQSILDFLKPYNIENLQEFYQVLFKLATNLSTQEEMDSFAKLLVHIYQKGYYRSVQDHQTALEKHGLRAILNH